MASRPRAATVHVSSPLITVTSSERGSGTEDSAAVHDTYRKAVRDVIAGTPPVTKDEAVQLAALQLRVALASGNGQPTVPTAFQLVPADYVSVPHILKEVQHAERFMSPKVTAAQAMAEYVTMVEELPTRPFTFYPATLYEPVLNNKTKVLLGFSPGSFTLLRAANKEKIYSSKWSAIGSLGAKSTSVTIHTKADGEFKLLSQEATTLASQMNVYLASSSSPRSSIIETHSAIGPSDRTYEEEAREFSHEFAKQKRAIQDAAQALSLALDKHDDVGLNQLAIDELTASRVNAHDHVSTALTSVATIVRLMNPLGVAASDEQRTQLIARLLVSVSDHLDSIAVGYVDLAISIRGFATILHRDGVPASIVSSAASLITNVQRLSGLFLEFFTAVNVALTASSSTARTSGFDRAVFASLARSLSTESARQLAEMSEVAETFTAAAAAAAAAAAQQPSAGQSADEVAGGNEAASKGRGRRWTLDPTTEATAVAQALSEGPGEVDRGDEDAPSQLHQSTSSSSLSSAAQHSKSVPSVSIGSETPSSTNNVNSSTSSGSGSGSGSSGSSSKRDSVSGSWRGFEKAWSSTDLTKLTSSAKGKAFTLRMPSKKSQASKSRPSITTAIFGSTSTASSFFTDIPEEPMSPQMTADDSGLAVKLTRKKNTATTPIDIDAVLNAAPGSPERPANPNASSAPSSTNTTPSKKADVIIAPPTSEVEDLDKTAFRRSISAVLHALESSRSSSTDTFATVALKEDGSGSSSRTSEDSASSGPKPFQPRHAVYKRPSKSNILTEAGPINTSLTDSAKESSSGSPVPSSPSSQRSSFEKQQQQQPASPTRTSFGSPSSKRAATIGVQHGASILASNSPKQTHARQISTAALLRSASLAQKPKVGSQRSFADLKTMPVVENTRTDELQVCEDAIDAIDDIVVELDRLMEGTTELEGGFEGRFSEYNEAISSVASVLAEDADVVVANACKDQQDLAIAASKLVSTVNILKETVRAAAMALQSATVREEVFRAVRNIAEKLQDHIYVAVRATEAQVRHSGTLVIQVRIPSKDMGHVSTMIVPSELALSDFIVMVADKHKLARDEYTVRLSDQKTDLPLSYSVGHIGVGLMVLMKTNERSTTDSALNLLGLRKKKPLQDLINEARVQSPLVYHTKPGKLPDPQRVKSLQDSAAALHKIIDEFVLMVQSRVDAETASGAVPALPETPVETSLDKPPPIITTQTWTADDAVAAAAVAGSSSPVPTTPTTNATPTASSPATQARRLKRRSSVKVGDHEINEILIVFQRQLDNITSKADDIALTQAIAELRSFSETVASQAVLVNKAHLQYQTEFESASRTDDATTSSGSSNAAFVQAQHNPREIILHEYESEVYRRAVKRCQLRLVATNDATSPQTPSSSSGDADAPPPTASPGKRRKHVDWRLEVPVTTSTSTAALAPPPQPQQLQQPAVSNANLSPLMAKKTRSSSTSSNSSTSSANASSSSSAVTIVHPVESLSQLQPELRMSIRNLDAITLLEFRSVQQYFDELKYRSDRLQALGQALGATSGSNDSSDTVLASVQEALPGQRNRLSASWDKNRKTKIEQATSQLEQHNADARELLQSAAKHSQDNPTQLVASLLDLQQATYKHIEHRKKILGTLNLLHDPYVALLRDYKHAKVTLFGDYVRAHFFNHLITYEAIATGAIARSWPLLQHLPSIAAVVNDVVVGCLLEANEIEGPPVTMRTATSDRALKLHNKHIESTSSQPASSAAALVFSSTAVPSAEEIAVTQLLLSPDVRKRAARLEVLFERLAANEAIHPTSSDQVTTTTHDIPAVLLTLSNASPLHGSAAAAHLVAKSLAAAFAFRYEGVIHLVETQHLNGLARLCVALALQSAVVEAKGSTTIGTPSPSACSLPNVLERMILGSVRLPWWATKADGQAKLDKAVCLDILAQSESSTAPSFPTEAVSLLSLIQSSNIEAAGLFKFTLAPTSSSSSAPLEALQTAASSKTLPGLFGSSQTVDPDAVVLDLNQKQRSSQAQNGTIDHPEAPFNVRRGLVEEIALLGELNQNLHLHELTIHGKKLTINPQALTVSKDDREAESLAYLRSSVSFMSKVFLSVDDLVE